VYRTFIFFRRDLYEVSPAVKVWWPGEVIDLLNRLPAGTVYHGGVPEGVCAAFIGACSSGPEARPGSLEVFNLRLRWGRQNELEGECGTPEHEDRWRDWLFGEIGWLYEQAGGRAEPPVLVDINPPFHATQGGKVLCRPLHLPYDPWEPGQPTWVAPG
jgi:hypothetical protein